MVSVAIVDGPAVGGGAELTTATDHRVFGPGAWLSFRQAALGVAAGWGGAVPLWCGEVAKAVQHINQGGALWVFKLPKA